MSTFDKLQERIKKDLGKELTNFKRLYHGSWQKGSGALAWQAVIVEDGRPSTCVYGSVWSATELLKEKKPLQLVGSEITPL